MKRMLLILAFVATLLAAASTAQAGGRHRCYSGYGAYRGYGYSYYRPYGYTVGYPGWGLGYPGYPGYGTGFGGGIGGIGLGYW